MKLASVRGLWRNMTGGRPVLPRHSLAEYKAALSKLSDNLLLAEWENLLYEEGRHMSDEAIIAALQEGINAETNS